MISERHGAAGADRPSPVLPDNIGFLVRMVQLRMFREFHRMFDGSDVTPGSLAALIIIEANPGVRQVELAEVLMVKPSNIAAMVSRLDECGLVYRSVDPDDRRSVHLGLTPRGEHLLEESRSRVDALESRLLAKLSGAERKTLRYLLDNILSGID
jgi:DNA-binding MarR family transcriptional regulator